MKKTNTRKVYQQCANFVAFLRECLVYVTPISSGEASRRIFGNLIWFLRRFMIGVVSVGPMPNHIAFIMNGNRRFARKRNLRVEAGHRFGLLSLMSVLKYCRELGLKFVTIFAFGIDNFNRHPVEVGYLMDLLEEQIEGIMKDESIVNRFGIRIHFAGNLGLLSESRRLAAERAMEITAENSKLLLTVCLAYSSTDEILHAVQESCEEKRAEHTIKSASGGDLSFAKSRERANLIKVEDLDKHTYTGAIPDPDMVVRTGGEKRLSNFLLWQSQGTYLHSTSVLWPDIGFRHLVWAVLNFQRNYQYLKRVRKPQKSNSRML